MIKAYTYQLMDGSFLALTMNQFEIGQYSKALSLMKMMFINTSISDCVFINIFNGRVNSIYHIQ